MATLMLSQRHLALILVAPALLLVAALFLYPLGFSLVSAFTRPDGAFTLGISPRPSSSIPTDIVFTLFIVAQLLTR